MAAKYFRHVNKGWVNRVVQSAQETRRYSARLIEDRQGLDGSLSLENCFSQERPVVLRIFMELQNNLKTNYFYRFGHPRGQGKSQAVPSSPQLFYPPQFHPYQPSCSILGILFILLGKELQAGLQVAHR